jgi:hypothetical protein
MAIVQISRITNRKGLTENLPQLAGAELGWCIDSRRLFIGNGTLQEGAPIIGNTEILTEFSDITSISEYIYRDQAVFPIPQTGPTPGDPVVRTVQDKLDDIASIRDFGAVGDGVADDTAAINRALFQLYCRNDTTQVRRMLYFPAGTYRVTDTIIIPTWAKLVGEGADCTILRLVTDDSSVPLYAFRLGDSLQQIGINIGAGGATAPRNIEISSMTFESAARTDVFLVEDATQISFDCVNFRGAVAQSELVAGNIASLVAQGLTAVKFASTPVLVCNQIKFDNCRFTNVVYAINTDQQIQSVTVSNSDFNTMYQGIVLGSGTPVAGGATGFRAVSNRFDNVYSEGVIYQNVSLNATAYNVFYNVGNALTSSPQTPVIRFGNDNNVSVNDFFTRTDSANDVFPRVAITGGVTTTGSLIQLGRYARETGRSFTCLDNQPTAQAIFSTTTGTVKAYRMNYTMVRAVSVRHGVLTVVSENGDDSAVTLSYTDDYSESADVGITLIPVQSGSTITVNYTSTSTGVPTGLTYSIEHLA